MNFKIAVLLIFISCLFFFGCVPGDGSENNKETEAEDLFNNEYIVTETMVWQNLAYIITGNNPLWFEIGIDGPILMDLPHSASLFPFSPWPHARHISGILLWEDNIIISVNRDGFLVLSGNFNSGEVNLYRISNSLLWDPYTTESLFVWENRVMALLYRNDFFIDELPPPPQSSIYTLDRYSPVPLPSNIPGLEIFPDEEIWETEEIFLTENGIWYYRMRKKETEYPESRYFRSTDLSAEGIQVSIDEWRNVYNRDMWMNPEYFNMLPELPDNFIYTGIIRHGNVLFASWEEQYFTAIGASGFMLINIHLEL